MPLDHAVAVVLDGSLLVIGGILNGRPSSTLWRLDPGSGSATRAGTLPEAVSIPAAAVLGGERLRDGRRSAENARHRGADHPEDGRPVQVTRPVLPGLGRHGRPMGAVGPGRFG
ncbi:kelch repeat-containing protein [Arthrobacter sp.]|uniref:kelch repeat-containing protein n=1 Tax=Arthrobacter sp. TaxID=1667 RepID=UPI00338FD6C5